MGLVPAIMFGSILLGTTAGTFRPLAAVAGGVVAGVGLAVSRDRLTGLVRDGPDEPSRRERLRRFGLFLVPHLLFVAGRSFVPPVVMDGLTSALVGSCVSLAAAGLALLGRWTVVGAADERPRTE